MRNPVKRFVIMACSAMKAATQEISRPPPGFGLACIERNPARIQELNTLVRPVN
ncbi:hypothetical protein [Paraburkholderia sediminicola]|uniref:hypothetical protein n=1 Tax=Paraburkholderia sediminicola TaxID=458836 RepID=UPI0038B83A2E